MLQKHIEIIFMHIWYLFYAIFRETIALLAPEL